ncbi:MAG: MBL fold metallo-hydrolase [Burkholderiaceae bacterium]|nr:MBL fold metallo-hydrolase [Burkholderiaceae bacterium]
MSNAPAKPTLDVLLEGLAISTSEGHPAFCGVYLVTGYDSTGAKKRLLIDPAHVGRRTRLWEELAKRELKATDIDMVLLTHAHWDHIQNIDVFANAEILIHPEERRYALRPHPNDWATPSWTGVMLEQFKLREVVDGDELLNGVTVVAMPGHSVGSIAVAIDTEEGLCVVTGDALHFAKVAETKINTLVFWDREQATKSIKRVVDMADLIYPAHDQPFRMTPSGKAEHLYGPKVTIRGTTPDVPGVSFAERDAASWKGWVMPGIEEQTDRLAQMTPAECREEMSRVGAHLKSKF